MFARPHDTPRRMSDSHLGPRVCRRGRSPGERAQSLVEFSLAVPLFLICVFGLIDLTRLAYAETEVAALSRAEATQMATIDQATSDCGLFQTAAANQALLVLPDPHSVVGDPPPSTTVTEGGPDKAPSDIAYLYLYPALAPISPSISNCQTSGEARYSGDVSATVTYGFQPLIPLISEMLPDIQLTSTTTVPTDY